MGSASSCPFCGSSLRDAPAPLATVAGVLLGLTLFGCGDDTASETGASSQTMSSTAGTETTETGTVGVTDTDSQGASDYGGPSTLEDTGLPQTTDTDGSSSDSSSSDDGSSGDTTAAESSSSDSGSSGTDTGSSSSDSGSAEGADYGAAPPKP